MKKNNKSEEENLVRYKNLDKNFTRLLLTDDMLVGLQQDSPIDYDAKYTFKLPLSTIRCLVYSCLDILYEGATRFVHTDSYGIGVGSNVYSILNDLIKELDKHHLDGRRIIDEVFNQSFKEKFRQLKEEEGKILADEEREALRYKHKADYFRATEDNPPF